MKNLLFVLLVFGFMSGCAIKPIQKGQVELLTKGISPIQVQSIFNNKTEEIFVHNNKGKQYLAEFYALQTGSRTQSTMSCTQYGCFPVYYTVAITAPYILIYSDLKLKHWGFVEALSKSESDTVVELVEHFKKLQKAKRTREAKEERDNENSI